MPTLKSLNPDRGAFLLFVSKSGGGKTSAAATFANQPPPSDKFNGRVKIFDFDGRAIGGQWTGDVGVDLDKVDVKFMGPNTTFKNIADEIDSIVMDAMKYKFPYQTYIFDSLTAEADLMLMDGMRTIQVGTGNDDRAKGGRAIGQLRVEGMADFQYESRAMKTLFDTVRPLTALGINMIFTTHIVPMYGVLPDEKGNVNPMGPKVEIGFTTALRDKLEAKLMIYFNEVYEFTKSPSGRIFEVKFKGTQLARTAYKNLPASMDLTEKNFYKLWSEKVNPAIESK